MKQPPTYSPVTIALRCADELPVLLDMMRAGGYGTYDSAIRGALAQHARHLGLDVPGRIFSLTPETPVAEDVTP